MLSEFEIVVSELSEKGRQLKRVIALKIVFQKRKYNRNCLNGTIIMIGFNVIGVPQGSFNLD